MLAWVCVNSPAEIGNDARVVLFGVADTARMDQALAIRSHVFIEEQKVPRDDEVDEHDLADPGAVHALAVARQGEVAMGTGRFFEGEPGCAQIGRMAVLAEYRGSGIGRQVLDALLADALRRGYRRARLLAQEHAIAFYERAGFLRDASGEEIWDAGILHRTMEKALA